MNIFDYFKHDYLGFWLDFLKSIFNEIKEIKINKSILINPLKSRKPDLQANMEKDTCPPCEVNHRPTWLSLQQPLVAQYIGGLLSAQT